MVSVEGYEGLRIMAISSLDMLHVPGLTSFRTSVSKVIVYAEVREEVLAASCKAGITRRDGSSFVIGAITGDWMSYNNPLPLILLTLPCFASG
jgi:hypothetical protein